jgi:hypothetical protein
MVIFKNFFGTSQQSEIMTTALDLATTAASFVSNKNDIAPLLYELKLVSSRSLSGGLLAQQDEEALFDIYLKLENYLTTADPIRKFNKTELRGKASRGLRSRLEVYENGQALRKKQTVNA